MPIPEELEGRGRCDAALAELGIDAEVVEPGVPMPTVPLAAEAVGVSSEQIIKTIALVDPHGEVVIAIASGTAKIDRGLVADAAGSAKLSLASPERVLTDTGYPAGGVAPIGLRGNVPTVIDNAVTELDVVYGGAGSEEALLRIRVSDLLMATGAIIAPIRRPD